MTNRSATTKNSKVYQQSKKDFRKDALAGDFSSGKGEYVKDYSHQGYEDRIKGQTLDTSSDDSESKDRFYKQSLGPNYQNKKPPATKDNTEKGKPVRLKDFLKMYGNFKNKNEFVKEKN